MSQNLTSVKKQLADYEVAGALTEKMLPVLTSKFSIIKAK